MSQEPVASARDFARRLAGDQRIIAVLLFGSVARGDAGKAGDVDLLVIRTSDSSGQDVRRLVSHLVSLVAGSPSPQVYALAQLKQEVIHKPSFTAHLADESLVLYQSPAYEDVKALLRTTRIDERSIEAEIDQRLYELDRLRHLERFNSNFVPCLAQAYRIGRAVVIARLLQEQIREYDWRHIFRLYARLRPDLHEDLHRIEVLRPFFEHVTGKSELPPAARTLDARRVQQVLDSVARVARSPA